jgi:hypothetical protein
MPDTSNTDAKGWVYLIVNDLIPTRVKVGYTMRFPIDRAQELVTTGTTGTFVVIYQALVHSPYRVEQEVHKRLASTNRGLEWFEVCPNRAKEEIISVAGGVLYEDTKPCWPRSQPEPSERTKELLHEAKKAADELRRLKWQAEEAARAATEERLRREAAETERLRRLKQLEDDRKRAEEAERLARQQEQERLKEEDRQRRLAEKKKQQALQAQRLIRNTKLGLGVTAAVFAACGLLYLAIGPFSPKHIATLHQRAATLAAEVQVLQDECRALQQKIQGATKYLSDLPTRRSSLEEKIAECQSNEEQSLAQLKVAEQRLQDFIATYKPAEGVVIPRGGVSLRWIEWEQKQRRANVTKAQSSYSGCRSATQSAVAAIQALPSKLTDLKASKEQLTRSLAVKMPQLTKKQRELKGAQDRLSAAIEHNSLFPWSGATVPVAPTEP